MIFTPRRWFLIRDNQLTLRAFLKVVILSPALRNHGETTKQGRNKMQNSKLYLASGERPFSILLDSPF